MTLDDDMEWMEDYGKDYYYFRAHPDEIYSKHKNGFVALENLKVYPDARINRAFHPSYHLVSKRYEIKGAPSFLFLLRHVPIRYSLTFFGTVPFSCIL